MKSEPIYIILVFGLLMFLGFGSLFSNRLIHDYPQGAIATDSFYKYNRAHYLLETGNFKYAEWYTVDGREDIEQDDSPLAYFLTAIYSSNSGIPDYDAYQFIGIIVKILSVFVAYLLIRKFNKNVALISLGLSGFIFIKMNFISFNYGWIPITVAGSLLIFIFWVLLNDEFNKIWILLGLGITAIALSHHSEFTYALLTCILFYAYKFVINKFDISVFKTPFFASIVFIPATLYFLPIIFRSVFGLVTEQGIITPEKYPLSFPITILMDFGIFLPFLAFGVLLAILYCVKDKQKIAYFLPFFIMIALSFLPSLPMFTFSDRIYQIRFFWPVFFMFFFGLGLFHTVSLFKKFYEMNFVFGVLSIFFLIVSIALYFTPPLPNSLIINEDMWDGMQWVNGNIPKDDSTLIIHGDSYQQKGVLLMFGRLVHEIKDEDYINKLQSGIVTRNYIIRRFIHGYSGYYIRNGLLNYELVRLGKPEWEQTRGWEDMDLCQFNYYVIDRFSRYPQATQYNLKIRDTLLKNKHFIEVFSNGWYSILNNQKPGEDCLET